MSKILDACEASASGKVETSDARALEIWRGHWGEWEGHVAELSDDEGDYANHDEHWHPPYFEVHALATDLDAVAAKLSPELDRALALLGNPLVSSLR